jgi:hypothetical protein
VLRRARQHRTGAGLFLFRGEAGAAINGQAAHQGRGAAHCRQHRQAAGPAPQAADLSVVVGAVDAGVMMRAMMLWLLLHYQLILGLRNARGYCARKWMTS